MGEVDLDWPLLWQAGRLLQLQADSNRCIFWVAQTRFPMLPMYSRCTSVSVLLKLGDSVGEAFLLGRRYRWILALHLE